MTRRVALLLVPLLLLTHVQRAHAVGSWFMGGPVAALGALSQRAAAPPPPPPPDRPGDEESAPPSPVSADTSLPGLELVESDHRVNVTIENGFARTEVTQVWDNPNAIDREARYAMPLPPHASLSELTITAGNQVLKGEVRGRDEAARIYEEEKQAGRNAGQAKKDDYHTFEFQVARVPARSQVRVRFVYYQPVTVDTGVARYTYPIQRDAVPDGRDTFWNGNVTTTDRIHATVTVKTAFPLESLRSSAAIPCRITRAGPGEMTADADVTNLSDFTIYYRLAKLPGRVEVIPYHAKGAAQGTFMAVVTPGADLPLIRSGADHVFVLDVSGSMRERIGALIDGTVQALGHLQGRDRFRIITFSDRADDVTGGLMPATHDNVARGIETLRTLTPGGATNLFDALKLALETADVDRVTNVILVTDGVTNQGELEPAEFRRLLTRADVRFHGFLMGSEANWPLMDTLAKASGGHYQSVVSSDDIAGVLRLAEGKLVSEAIHDVHVTFDGGDVTETTQAPPRVFHGEQLVLFGRYGKPGPAKVKVTARIAGRPYTYEAAFQFPAEDTRAPELTRLYGVARCEEWKQLADAHLMDDAESRRLIRALGTEAQVVTDETSMVLLTDGQFAARGITRVNAAQVAAEQDAQAQRAAAPAINYTAAYVPPPAPRTTYGQTYTYTPPAPTYAPHVSDPSPGRSYSHRGGGAFDHLRLQGGEPGPGIEGNRAVQNPFPQVYRPKPPEQQVLQPCQQR